MPTMTDEPDFLALDYFDESLAIDHLPMEFLAIDWYTTAIVPFDTKCDMGVTVMLSEESVVKVYLLDASGVEVLRGESSVVSVERLGVC